MATGLARRARIPGKRIAFGDGQKIMWDLHSETVFRYNRKIAKPGTEKNADDLEWVPFYKGNRIYNSSGDNRWIWNYDFHPVPGEVFLSPQEKMTGRRHGVGYIIIEPNVQTWKSSARNKDWGFRNYQAVADKLRATGFRLIQFGHDRGGSALKNVTLVHTASFRDALALMRNAMLYIGPEGGLHHAAAAFSIPAVVLFGGFVPPSVTGYPMHTNLTGGAEACGSFRSCVHCMDAMERIAVDEVLEAVKERLGL